MKKTVLFSIVTLLMISCMSLLLVSCESGNKYARSFVLTNEQKVMVQNSNQFSLKLFQKACESEAKGKNIFISPLSVSIALSMAANGADTETLDEMMDVLGFSDYDIQDVNDFYRILLQSITKLDNTSKFKIANAIWADDEIPLLEDYKNSCKKYFAATLETIDFSDVDYCINHINQWGKQHTDGLIPKIVDESIITPDVAVVIANAIYFKSKWAKQFDKKDTQDKTFHNFDGTTSTVPMMSLKDKEFKVGYFDDAKVLEMDYKGGKYCMNIILPNKYDEFDDFIRKLDGKKLGNYLENGNEEKVYIEIPKFELKYNIGMAELLQDMGMERAFTPIADFSKMSSEALAIDKVSQSSYLSIDEEGTKAAAVTVVSLEKTSALEASFIVDHPFLFLIREKVQNNIVFLGKIEKL